MSSLQLTFEKLVRSLLLRLEDDETRETDLLIRLESCIRSCEESLQWLRQWVIDNAFPDNDTEIYFFKKIKPEVVSRYLFYNKQFRLHLDSCSLSREMRITLCKNQLRATQQFLTDHHFDHSYHATGNTCYDEHYFLRSKYDWKLRQDNHHPAEPGFVTNGDGMLANILANKLWSTYLLEQVEQPEGMESESGKSGEDSRLTWTGPSTALVENIYAWHALGWCGNNTIKKVMEGVSRLFGKDLGDYYRKIQHIDNRKINQTKGLDQMKTALLNRFQQRNDRQD